MLETSRWILHIDNMFMHEDLTGQINVAGDGSFEIFAVTDKGLKPFPKEVAEKLSINGDTIEAEISNDEMPGMKIKVAVTFKDEKAEGYFKLPILGKMKFGGERVEMTDLPIIEAKSETAEENADSEE